MSDRDSAERPNGSRMHSPSSLSVSSANSVRPLEWDSGADVGYQCTSNSGLSTVERIALARGSSFFQHAEAEEGRTYSFNNPVAVSTPEISDQNDECEIRRTNSSNFNTRGVFSKDRTVPFSTSNERIKCPIPEKHTIHKFSKNNAEDYKNLCKYGLTFGTFSNREVNHNRPYHSLNDLSRCVSKRQPKSDEMRYRKRELNRTDFASSSVSTIIPRISADSAESRQNSCSEILKNDENNNQGSGNFKDGTVEQNASSSSENLKNDDLNADKNSYNWFKTISNRLTASGNRSSSDSVDKVNSFEYFSGSGSFKYVSGSAYECKTTSASISHHDNIETDHSINIGNSIFSGSDRDSFNGKVQCGVNMITEYIENLNISNKQKVLKKVIQSLVLKTALTSDKINKSAPKSKPFHEIASSQHVISGYNTEYKSSSSGIKSEDGYCGSTSTSNAYHKSSISSKTTNDSNLDTVLKKDNVPQKSELIRKTNLTTDSTVSEISHHTYTKGRQKKDNDVDNLNRLQKCLATEKEIQLKWIKNGIVQLSNLEKLYENYVSEIKKLPPEELNVASNKTNQFAGSLRIAADEVFKNNDHHPSVRNGNVDSSHCKRTIKDDKNIFKNYRKIKPQCSSTKIKTADLDKEKQRTSDILVNGIHYIKQNDRIIMKPVAPRCDSEKNSNSSKDLHANNKNHSPIVASVDKGKTVSEHLRSVCNKENINSVQNFDKNCRTICCSRCRCNNQKNRISQSRKVKSTISYTILFQNKSPWNNKISKSGKRKRKSKSAVILPEQNATTLQDYLIKNRPDYIDHAETRRQCLAEIAYLRNVRSEMKKQIFNKPISEITNSICNQIPPNPLAMYRIFDQKQLRRQTEMKYQKLPEVLNRKMEMKRKEEYQTNRIMAKVFTKKLQKRTLKGQVNLSNSVSVIA